ncbi:hypothetical protein HDE_02435 [Halotydeus destructor]|nr:hypothetical protein HDE_02435 [Halotydeus destructor]
MKDHELILKVAERKRHVALCRGTPFWASINGCSALLLYIELYFGLLRHLIGISFLEYSVIVLESILLFILIGNTAWNAYLFCWLYWFMVPIELRQSERLLLRVKENELGFTDYVPKPVTEEEKQKEQRPEADSPRFSISPSAHFSTSRTQNSIMSASPGSDMSYNTTSPNLSVNASSWLYQSGQFGYSPSPQQQPSLRKRVLSRNSSTANAFKDDHSLNDYLHSFEEMESKVKQLKDYEQKQSSLGDVWTAVTRDKNGSMESYKAADDSMVIGSSMDLSHNDSAMLVDSTDSPMKAKEEPEPLKDWELGKDRASLFSIFKDNFNKTNSTKKTSENRTGLFPSLK